MTVDIQIGDCRTLLTAMEPQSVNCCVTSPPYFGLRDYGVDGQIGLEQTPDEYVAKMVAVFREVRRVMRDDGTLWLNLGDSYAAGGSGGSPSNKSTLGIAPGYGPKNHEAAIRYGRKQGESQPRKIPSGIKPKDLIGIPWRVAFALQADGWYLRQDIIWHKPNPMPESVRDRCTKAHEYVFMLSKSARYYYDHEAVAEEASDWSKKALAGKWVRKTEYGTGEVSGRNSAGQNYADRVRSDGKRNRRSVWTVSTKPFKGAHFATFPPDLIEPCILAGCPKDGIVLDPFGGAGTTGLVAKQHGRNAILLELNPEYAAMARERIDAPVVPKRKRAVPANDNVPDLFSEAA